MLRSASRHQEGGYRERKDRVRMRMWETGPPARSVGMHDAAAARKTGWQFFKKFEKESTKQPSDSTSESVPRRTESRVLERYLYTHVHCSTIHNSNLKIYQRMNGLKKMCYKQQLGLALTRKGILTRYTVDDPWVCTLPTLLSHFSRV